MFFYPALGYPEVSLGVAKSMHNWQWQEWEGLPYLRCSLLDAWPHGFFSQSWWPRHPANLVHALQPSAGVYRVKQVHGNRVLPTSKIEPIAASDSPDPPAVGATTIYTFAEADGLVSTDANQSLWVSTADCTPVLIADDRTGQVASVHAGWRGTAAKIVPAAIAQLQAQGSRLANLRVAMGPAIAGEVYQVEQTVAAALGQTLFPELEQPQEILSALTALPQSPVQPDPKPDRVRLDVRRVNALQLEQLGLDPEQLAIAPHCTYQEPDYFFSYRRTHEKKVQWSGIVS
jgi:YfiH family protein